MDVRERPVEILKLPDGAEPFSGWFADLKDVRAKAAILARINRAQMGNFGDHKFLSGTFGEMRIDLGLDIGSISAFTTTKSLFCWVAVTRNLRYKISIPRKRSGSNTKMSTKPKLETTSYSDFLAKQLSDPELAAAFLEECLSSEPELFLRALRDVVQAQMSMTDLARTMQADRSRLYTSLSEDGNPEFKTLVGVLNNVGLRLSVKPLDKAA